MELRKLPRFAIFFVPGEETGLAALGHAWLGRDLRSGRPEAQPDFAEPGTWRLAALTERPRHYGFHATLKAPFRLKRGVLLPALEARCASFVKEITAFRVPSLAVGMLDGFLALLPKATSLQLDILASACVESFDDLRAPEDDKDRRKRRAVEGLSDRQAAYLKRWGYPYVMEEFRFHMTLTERLDEAEAAQVEALARRHFEPVLHEPVAIDAISLVAQPDLQSPFRELQRYPLNPS